MGRPPARVGDQVGERGPEGLFVELFLDAHKTPPEQIILDLTPRNCPLRAGLVPCSPTRAGNRCTAIREGRFSHGDYDCYCYLPLYVFCGRHLLAAKLRRSNIDAAAGSVEEIARIPHRPSPYPVRHRHLRNDPPKAARNRRLVRISVRPIKAAMASACPYRAEYRQAYLDLARAAYS